MVDRYNICGALYARWTGRKWKRGARTAEIDGDSGDIGRGEGRLRKK